MIEILNLRFQFHKGTIKTEDQFICEVTNNVHFNSIKVRLKQSREKETEHDQRFQFHKGTIKTYKR